MRKFLIVLLLAFVMIFVSCAKVTTDENDESDTSSDISSDADIKVDDEETGDTTTEGGEQGDTTGGNTSDDTTTEGGAQGDTTTGGDTSDDATTEGGAQGDTTTGNDTSDDTTTDNGVELPFTLVCLAGTENCYTFENNTLTFTEISEETTYKIAGELNGNIIFDVGDTYKFTLEMHGFTLSCDSINPITALSGKELEIKAKKDYESFIYDNREAIDQTDETLYSGAIYSLVDLEISGKGSLAIISQNNNGVHTKDDLQVKNLTLYVKCVDNALKGNDSVELENAIITLIATQGDCIKTTNSHINETTLNQKGTISLLGGEYNLYSACDAIDSAYNVTIDDETTVLNIYTEQYSEYSEEVTNASEEIYYIRNSSQSYNYSIYYYNSDNDYAWENAEYYTNSGRYYYYKVAKRAEYSKLIVYMYSSNQEQGQSTSYYKCTSALSINDSQDTISLSTRQGTLSVSWTTYSTSSSSSGGMGGGMSEGNTDKNDYSTKGIKAANEIIILNGTITIKAFDDAIHANNDGGTLENGSEPTGNVTISGGNITIYSNDDGLHADGTLDISGGKVSITNSYEGVEGLYIKISGGSLSVISKDDGFNGTSTTGASIEISGGEVYVYAQGDGIDSNSTTSKGAIVFSGGKTVVICNSNGNSAIDSDGGYTHSGGEVIAIMTTGGMTSETTNGNAVQMTTKSQISISNSNYLTVTANGETRIVVSVPSSMTAYVVYLGSSSATISTSTELSVELNSNGVYWAN